MRAFRNLPNWSWLAILLPLLPALIQAGGQTLEWPPEKVVPPRMLNAIAFGNGIFVAVGPGTSILSSRDGTNWVNQSSRIDNLLVGLNYESETYAFHGDSVVLASAESAEFKTQASSMDLNAVVHGRPGFVAVGSLGGILFSSAGERWTIAFSGTRARLQAVAWGAGRFVAVGENGTVLSSSDGLAWTRETSGTRRALYGVTYGNDTFVIVGDAGTILTSSDGNKWRAESAADDAPLRNVLFGNGSFLVTAGLMSSYAVRSVGTHNWTRVYPPVQVTALGFGNGLFIAAGNTTAVSTDARAWRSAPADRHTVGLVSLYTRSIAAGNGLFVFAGAGIKTSADGLRLSVQDLPWSRLMAGWLSSNARITTFRPICLDPAFFASLPGEIWSTNGTQFRAYSWRGPFTGSVHGNAVFAMKPALRAKVAVLGSDDGVIWHLLRPGLAPGSPVPLLPASQVITADLRPAVPNREVSVHVNMQELKLVLPAVVPSLVRVEASTNLFDWSDVGCLTNNNGLMQFLDPDAQNYPRRFYRLVVPGASAVVTQ